MSNTIKGINSVFFQSYIINTSLLCEPTRRPEHSRSLAPLRGYDPQRSQSQFFSREVLQSWPRCEHWWLIHNSCTCPCGPAASRCVGDNTRPHDTHALALQSPTSSPCCPLPHCTVTEDWSCLKIHWKILVILFLKQQFITIHQRK